MVFIPLYSQQYKYDNWPLQDNTKEVEASFGEYTPTSKVLHEALDIYGAGKTEQSKRKAKAYQCIFGQGISSSCTSASGNYQRTPR